MLTYLRYLDFPAARLDDAQQISLQIPLEEIENAGVHLIRRRATDAVRFLRVQHIFELLSRILERIGHL
jgi:hypothetical protein